MITYLNRYSTKLAKLTSPLRDLIKKNAHFKWQEQHQTALNKIKEELCSVPVTSYYDPNPGTVTVLQCDAIQGVLGEWIGQVDLDNNERTIAMFSQTPTDTEKRYSNIEPECLAVVYGLERFEFHLLGRTTIIETDHSPLNRHSRKTSEKPLEDYKRILLRCLRFDPKVTYKPGKMIPVADALSRVCFNKSQQIKGNTAHFVTDTP